MEAIGRRQRKKAQTRRQLSDAAFQLFSARGFDQVTVAEVAEAADVAVSTLFSYFPSKEALIFDQDAERESALVAAVTKRAPGVSVLQALRTYLPEGYSAVLSKAGTTKDQAFTEFRALISRTPALQDYLDRMQARHEIALAQAIAAESNLPISDASAAALARFALGALSIAGNSDAPTESFNRLFDRLARGWDDFAR